MNKHQRMTAALIGAANLINEALALASSGPERAELQRLYLAVVNAPMELGLAVIEDGDGWCIAPTGEPVITERSK